jgi:Pyruvate/2-oxoacid:ferredoxin oxidoreductase gamma subunit
MLAKALVSEGKHVASFPMFGVERRAPRSLLICASTISRSEKKLKYIILIAS